MCAPRVIVVLLRRPKRQADERRDDPFWEFGSFGCTGCHHRNLLNPKRSSELEGTRLAFVQGGDGGLRLVHVTPPISVRGLADICEAIWLPAEMPLTYATAPVVLDRQGRSDLPLLAEMAHGVSRSTPVARFASAFRCDGPREWRARQRANHENGVFHGVLQIRSHPDNAPFTSADTLAKSILPACLPFSAPITLPMSFIPAAPVSCMASAMAALTSSSDICLGK